MSAETVGSIAILVGGEVHGDANRPITGVADFRRAGPQHVGFLNDKSLIPEARNTAAAALLVKTLVDTPATQIVVSNVVASFARVAQHFHPTPNAKRHEVHESAVVAPDAVLHEPVSVGPGAVIGARVEIGAGTIVAARVVIGERCRIGENSHLYPGVVLYPGVTVGKRVVLHAGCVLGSDGFGYAQDDDGSHVKFPQLGTVIIEDDVEIGVNTAVDRAALGVTKIGRGSKIDNLVHIAHNCQFGENVAVAGFSAFSGSTILGNRVMVAGHTVSAGHLRVADDVRLGGNTVIYRDVEEPGDYIGYPPQLKRKWFRTLRALDELLDIKADVKRLIEERDASS